MAIKTTNFTEENQAFNEDNGTETQEEVQITPVRYKGGETANDIKGRPFTKPASIYGYLITGLRPIETLDAKENEPEYGYEWAEEAATRVWDSGKSLDEIEKEMNKEYPLAAARINEATENKSEYERKNKTPPYYKPLEIDDGEGGKYTSYVSPKIQAEIEIAHRYGFMIDEGRPESTLVAYKPSEAARLINTNKELKEKWQAFNDGKFNAKDLISRYNDIKRILSDMSGATRLEKVLKLGFSSQADYDLMIGYLSKSLDARLSKYAKDAGLIKNNEKSDDIKPADITTKEEVAKASTKDVTKDTADLKVKEKASEKTDEVKEEAATSAKASTKDTADLKEKASEKIDEVKEEISPEVEITPASLEEDQVLAEADEAALKTENLVNADKKNAEEREEARQRIEEIDKEIEDAAARKRQDQFDYEDWLKNPTLISGIFGHSGLSIAKRIGLGTAALFAIFSDVAANYAKGINNVTDFKTAAFDELNKTVEAIQDKRAEKIGEMAGKPYITTSENEEKLNKDYEKLRRTYAGTYIPSDTLKAFIQESQLDTAAPISDELYESFTNESRKGFIDSMNKALKEKLLDSEGNLTPEGEVYFLKKQAQALNIYKNALNISGERMANIENRLALERERAETRAKVHDVYFQNNMDYVNAINNMEAENQALVAAKLDFTEKRTLDAMQESAKKFRDTISGLATSTSSAASAESEQAAILNNFTKQKGLEKVNEELKKHGYEAELNAEAGAKVPIKVIPLSAEVSGGGKWTKEQADKYVESEYERSTNNYQRSANKARSLSNASGENIDRTYELILNFLNTEKAKGASADYESARKNILDAIDRKIEYNNSVIDELKDMKSKEKRFDTSVDDESASTSNPYVSMFNSVPTKNAEWYKRMLSLT